MTSAERAKQFLPFAAVQGLNDALAEKEKTRTPRRELSEDAANILNEKLLQLQRGQTVTAIYYHDENYVQLTGTITCIYRTARAFRLHVTDIAFSDLWDIILHEEASEVSNDDSI